MDFTYTAITKDGKKETSSIQALDKSAAGHLLKERGFLLMEIRETGKKTSFGIFKELGSVPLKEKINFVENISIMLKAGISISRALQIVVNQTKNHKFKNIVSDIYNQVQQGKGLSEALSAHPKIFSGIFLSMIKVGELSGNLDKSLEYLGVQLQREASLKSKVRGAMIYPSVIVCAMVIIGLLMAIFVLPQMTSVFKESSVPLPFATRVVIGMSDFMSSHSIVVVLGMFGLVGGFIAALRTYGGRKIFNFLCLHFMVIGGIIKKINIARFARILSSLLKSGLPIVQALDVAAGSLDNLLYKELVSSAALDVKVGKPLTDSLGKDRNLFPVLVVQMIEVGEESGTVQEILEQLADHYEEEVDTILSNLSSIIEPLLLLFIGGVVGLLAMALIAPIYSMSQSIQ